VSGNHQSDAKWRLTHARGSFAALLGLVSLGSVWGCAFKDYDYLGSGTRQGSGKKPDSREAGVEVSPGGAGGAEGGSTSTPTGGKPGSSDKTDRAGQGGLEGGAVHGATGAIVGAGQGGIAGSARGGEGGTDAPASGSEGGMLQRVTW
jgi:hypothetical protein